MAYEFYRRNLPHWIPDGRTIFLTWRLYGSLPEAALKSLRAFGPRRSGYAFRFAERILDKAEQGPLWLTDPRIAQCVVNSLLRGDVELLQYSLHSFVVMANHVHALLNPKVKLSRITNGLKGVTSREANRILDRTGQPFWQVESFDHWVRHENEFQRIKAYIENNPVVAGLVKRPEDWPWSSAAK